MIALEGGFGAELFNRGDGGALKIHGRRTGADFGAHSIMHLAQRNAGGAHLLNFRGGFDLDGHRSEGPGHRARSLEVVRLRDGGAT